MCKNIATLHRKDRHKFASKKQKCKKTCKTCAINDEKNRKIVQKGTNNRLFG